MYSFEDVGRLLDEIVDALPSDLSKGLNGGIISVQRQSIIRISHPIIIG